MILLVILASSGLIGSLPGVQPFSIFSTLPIWLFILGIVAAVFFVVMYTVVSTLFKSASVLCVSHADDGMGVKQAISDSFKFVIPLVVTNIILSFFMLGGLFVFLFPALLFYFLFQFVIFEIILNNQKLLGAVKRSVLLVSRRFGEIFIRILVLIGIYILIAVILPNIFKGFGEEMRGVFSLLTILINTLVGWFGLVYTLTLYKQAKVGLDQEKAPSITWIFVISILGWAILILFSVLGFRLLSSINARVNTEEVTQKVRKPQIKNIGSGLSHEIGKCKTCLSEQMLADVNMYRRYIGLDELNEDKKLCAYAQRRLQQMIDAGGYDNDVGYQKDLKNQQIKDAYFKDYGYINQHIIDDLTKFESSREILDVWTSGEFTEDKISIVGNPIYTDGCVRADDQALVFMAGARK
jgi:hypothetical protein